MTKPHTPHLFLMLGLPGAGKTTVARWLSELHDAKHVWVDGERRRLLRQPTFQHKENMWLYDQLNQRTLLFLSRGQGVVYDAAFNFRADRTRMRELAAKHNATTTVVWVHTPEHIARERAVRMTDGDTRVLGQMDDTLFDKFRGKLEVPHKSEQYVQIDGTSVDKASVYAMIQETKARRD